MSIVSFHCVPRIVQLCYIFVVRGRTDFEHLEIFVNKPVRYWQISSSMYLARTGKDRTPDTKQDRKQNTSDSGSEG